MAAVVSKLKQRRQRRTKADLAWWKAEAEDWKQVALEHAAEIDHLRSQVLRVPMPVIVPSEVAHQLDDPLCRTCNDGVRGGCSSCAFRN